MEEDCRQKKSTLTPAPRGREEVFYHSHHPRCHFGFSPTHVFLSSLVVYSVFTKKYYSSLVNLSVLSLLSTGGREGTLAKAKTWHNSCRWEVSDEKFQKYLHYFSFRRSRVRQWMKTYRTLTQPSFRGWTFTIWSVELFYPYSDNLHKPETLQPDGSILSSFW